MVDENLIQFIIENYPKKAYEISEVIDMLIYEVDEIIDMINSSISEKSKERKYKEARLHIERAKEIELVKHELINMNDKIKQDINDSTNTSIVQDETKDDAASKSETRVGETLKINDDPTGQRPFQLKIRDKIMRVFDWRDLYVKACEYFAAIDPAVFSKYIGDPKMNGKRKPYFSYKIDRNMVYPRKLKATDIYIETGIGTRKYLDLIREMLIDYGIAFSEFEIYVHR